MILPYKLLLPVFIIFSIKAAILTAGGIVLWTVKAIPKLLLCAVVYRIWGEPVVKDIKAIRCLLEERRDSEEH